MPRRGGRSAGPLPMLPPLLPPELLLLVLSLSGGRIFRNLAPARAAARINRRNDEVSKRKNSTHWSTRRLPPVLLKRLSTNYGKAEVEEEEDHLLTGEVEEEAVQGQEEQGSLAPEQEHEKEQEHEEGLEGREGQEEA
ncbi:hypothetical protein FHG87_002948 [Trinorchestia longiramus]|nr:hypothetical protein FHG87_002948 [Trinorchestia longiramus]